MITQAISLLQGTQGVPSYLYNFCVYIINAIINNKTNLKNSFYFV